MKKSIVLVTGLLALTAANNATAGLKRGNGPYRPRPAALTQDNRQFAPFGDEENQDVLILIVPVPKDGSLDSAENPEASVGKPSTDAESGSASSSSEQTGKGLSREERGEGDSPDTGKSAPVEEQSGEKEQPATPVPIEPAPETPAAQTPE